MSFKPFEDIIIGGGIIGLSIGVELLKKYPSRRVLIIEKHRDVGYGQTGNNSNVLHSGIYYDPNSLKSKLCIEGNKLWKEYCINKHIPIQESGKYIIATNKIEEKSLNRLIENANSSNIPYRIVNQEELKNEKIKGKIGIFVKSTASLDFNIATQSLKSEFLKLGGSILFDEKVVQIDDGIVTTKSRLIIKCSKIILSAGLGVDSLYPSKNYFHLGFNGYYYKTPKFRKSDSLVYPAPNPQFPFLGIHSCRNSSHFEYFGPNALPSFINTPEKQFLLKKGFYKLIWSLRRTGAKEILTSISSFFFKKEIKKLFEVTELNLSKGFVGTRAQCVSSNGELIDDFIIDGDNHVIVLRNVPSPAATSSLALAKFILNNYYEKN